MAIEIRPKRDVVDFLGKHFVSLVWIDRTPLTKEQLDQLRPPPVFVEGIQGRVFGPSGFLFSVLDRWYMVTAGHVVRDIDLAISNGQKLEKFQLHDAWSKDAPHHLPLPF